MLSKKEWVKEKVVKWQGIKNCDTKRVAGGYLYMRQEDGSVIGSSSRNCASRSEAIAYHYGLYVESATQQSMHPTSGTLRGLEVLSTPEENPAPVANPNPSTCG